MEDVFVDALIASASSILLLFSMMVLVGLMKQAPQLDSLGKTLVAAANGSELLDSEVARAISDEQLKIGSCTGSQNLAKNRYLSAEAAE